MRRASALLLLCVVSSAGCGTEVTTDKGNATSTSGSGGAGGAGESSMTTSPVTVGSTMGTGGSGGMGGMDQPPSNIYPAFHPSVPIVETYPGGPVLAAPNVYPVFFSNDDPTFTPLVQDFVTNVGATAYWAANATEYGVGAMTGNPAIQLTEPAPDNIDDSAIQAWLLDKLAGGTFPVPDDNTLFALFYPTGTTITEQGTTSCQYFGGYHFSVKMPSGQDVAYAVVPRCHDFNGFHGIDAVTSAASHEFLEASTDPYPQADPAYTVLDNDHFYWEIALGPEIGDMCEFSPQSFTKFPPFPYAVQRAWSNASAQALHDPCMPNIPGVAYFNTVPVLPDETSVMGGTFHTAKIAEGATKDVELQCFSDAPTNGPWHIDVQDFASSQPGGQPELQFQIDDDSCENGQTRHLSVTVLKASQYNVELFYIFSGNQDHSVENVWVGAIGN